MLRLFTRFIYAALFTATLFTSALAQEFSIEEAAQLLPDKIGDFQAEGAPQPMGFGIFELIQSADFGVVSHARRRYVSPSGDTLSVHLVKSRADSGAYSLLTYVASASYIPPSPDIKLNEVGTASVSGTRTVSFFKGPVFVDITATSNQAGESEALKNFARLLAETLDAGEGSVPVLALHLPEWERVQGQADYAVSLPALKALVGDQPILDSVSLDGGAEAATATYGDSRLVIVEFTTPQHSVENDARITQRIAELRAANLPVPSAYRREGNYSVFVFDAPDEAAAAGLIEQVKYEKDVRWLGDNPRVGQRVEQLYRTTMTGVLVTTLKATGLAIIICLGIGGIFGGAVFFYRRTRPAAKEAFTDAGGMMRLDIEDVNAPRDSSKLLGEAAKQYRER